MFARLIDFVLEWIEKLYFFTIVRQYQRGLVLRYGRFHRLLEPGFHLVWPVIEDALTDGVVTRTEKLGEQSLTTKDAMTITFRLVVTANISDIHKATLGVEGVDDALIDSCCGTASEMIIGNDWEEIRKPEFLKQLTRKCHLRARRYGWEITEVAWSDLIVTPAYRVFGIGNQLKAA